VAPLVHPRFEPDERTLGTDRRAGPRAGSPRGLGSAVPVAGRVRAEDQGEEAPLASPVILHEVSSREVRTAR
jgi:hypothetical protein